MKSKHLFCYFTRKSTMRIIDSAHVSFYFVSQGIILHRYVDFIRTAMLVISQAIYVLRMTEKKKYENRKKSTSSFQNLIFFTSSSFSWSFFVDWRTLKTFVTHSYCKKKSILTQLHFYYEQCIGFLFSIDYN